MDLVCGMYRVYICICVCGVYIVSGCMCAYMWHEVCAACVVVCGMYLCVGVLEETKWEGWEENVSTTQISQAKNSGTCISDISI